MSRAKMPPSIAYANTFAEARSCARAPVASCCSVTRVSGPLKASTVGASIGFATGLSLQPAAINAPRRRAVYRFILVYARLEGCVDREIERSTRRIRRDVLESAQRLVTKV